MRRRKTAIFFLIFGICLSAAAVALNITWILLNLREVVLLVFGVIFFAAIITGLILNTIFLLREIRRNEQHDAFLNAVTHELKTPIASIKLYLETLKGRDIDDEERVRELSVRVLASNRHLPDQLPVGEAGADFLLVEDTAVPLRCIAGPTRPRESIVQLEKKKREARA